MLGIIIILKIYTPIEAVYLGFIKWGILFIIAFFTPLTNSN